jgi:pimeloyl-ACP methyl ester carboxylesterase
MNRITTKDGTSIFYKDWGIGPAVVFSHGWPSNADVWDAQMLFLGRQGYRVVAHDRRDTAVLSKRELAMNMTPSRMILLNCTFRHTWADASSIALSRDESADIVAG